MSCRRHLDRLSKPGRLTLGIALAILLMLAPQAVAAKSWCSADGKMHVAEASDGYIITMDGMRSRFIDAGGIGTGIAGRLFTDDEGRGVGIYLPYTRKERAQPPEPNVDDGFNRALSGNEIGIIKDSREWILKLCKR